MRGPWPDHAYGDFYAHVAPVRSLGCIWCLSSTCSARSGPHHLGGFVPGRAESNYPQSPRPYQYPMRKLPHLCRLATDPGCPRIRSQQNEISIAQYARKSEMRSVPHSTGLHQRRQELRRLSRGHSPSPNGIRLRAVSHRKRLEYCPETSSGSPESLSTSRRSRRRPLRFLP
jgi:hypothetical protein